MINGKEICQILNNLCDITILWQSFCPCFREEAVAKANVLLERNEKEKKQHVLEISELKRLIRHEDKLLDFMSKKNQDRIFLETDDERLSE